MGYYLAALLVVAAMGCFFFFKEPATTDIYTLSLHDALPIFLRLPLHALVVELVEPDVVERVVAELEAERSEEHTSELQSQSNIVCRLLLEKKKAGLSLDQSRAIWLRLQTKSEVEAHFEPAHA